MNDFSHIPENRLSAAEPLRQAQLVMLRILRVFDEICKKYAFTYWLDAGTLLGAVRHKGFIPWDDDVDVMMPLEDYNRFCEIAEKELPFDMFFQTAQTDPEHDMQWAKIRDRFSYMDDPGGPYNYNQGIPIDIFPAYRYTKRESTNRNIFVLFSDEKKRLKISKRNSYKRNLYLFFWKTVRFIIKPFILLPFIRGKIQTWGQKGARGFCYSLEQPWFHFFPTDCVLPLSTVKFENYEFYAPCNVNEYLTICYGDWQKIPPPAKRDKHGVLGIHPTDAGPRPDKHSLKWEDYYGNAKKSAN